MNKTLPVTRLGDVCTGHGCWPSRPCITASRDVYSNKLPVHRQGDYWAVHCCFGCHKGNLKNGSPTVFVNNKECGRVTSPVDCGSYVLTGSPNVFCE